MMSQGISFNSVDSSNSAFVVLVMDCRFSSSVVRTCAASWMFDDDSNRA